MAKRELSDRAFTGLTKPAEPKAHHHPKAPEPAPERHPHDDLPRVDKVPVDAEFLVDLFDRAGLPGPAPAAEPSEDGRARRPQLITTTVRLTDDQRRWLKKVADARERARLEKRYCDASAVLRELIERAIAEKYK
jgi:hypothetical protein